MNIKVIAPAKINFALSIKGKRHDGYHEVDMVMQSVDLCDTVTVEKYGENIKVACDKDIGCKAEDNIAYRAVEKFFKYTGMTKQGVSVNINKFIPMNAGLAGGSSDGAAVILALDKIFNTNLKKYQLEEIGSEIGADVPFCISGGTARAQGNGTLITRIRDFKDCGIVIVKPECDISTKEAYAMYDKLAYRTSVRDINDLVDFINEGNVYDACKRLFNDFERLLDTQYMVGKDIIGIKKEMSQHYPLGMCMSGSGPSVFGIFKDFRGAEECRRNLQKIYNQVFACRPLSHGVRII